MTVDSQYGDSSPEINQNICEQADKWQRIDAVAERLLSKCAAALHANLPEAAETYHAMWIEEATKIWEGADE